MKPQCRSTSAGAAAGVLALGLLAAAPVFAQTELSLSAWVPPTHMIVKDILQPWAAEVDKATAGRVKVRFLPKAVTNPINHFDAARDGLADVVFISHSYTPARFALTRFGVLPFTGDNAEASSVAMERIYAKHLARFDEHKGVKLLAIYTHGPGLVWTTRKAVTKIEDFNGLKIRVGGGMAADVGNVVGITPIVKPAPESYELLSSGVVDGVFFPGESVASFKLDKLIKFATTFPGGLYSDSHAVLMNEGKFNALSRADQDAVMRVSGENLARLAGKAWDKHAQDGFTLVRANKGEILKADAALVAVIRERTARFEEEWIKTATEKGIDAKRVLGEYRDVLKAETR